MPLSWLQRQKSRWSPRIAIGTAVTVGGVSGYTVQGYDYAGKRYRCVKDIPDPPSRSDVMAAESQVVVS